MGDSINEILKNIRERFASPFFFSFLISWIIWNWKVTVALLWYNPELYPKQGDLATYISYHTSLGTSLVWPLVSAILYTTLFRVIISGLTELTTKWSENLNLRISKKSNVPIEKFLTYRNLYVNSHKELEIIIKDESKQIEENHKLKQEKQSLEVEKLRLEGEKNDLNNKLTKLEFERSSLEINQADLELKVEILEKFKVQSVETSRQLSQYLTNYRNINMMDGNWEFQYNNQLRNINFKETLKISDGVVSVVNYGEIKATYNISFFFYDEPNAMIFLQLKFIAGTSQAVDLETYSQNLRKINSYTLANSLIITRITSEFTLNQQLQVKNENLFVGTENMGGLIQYKKLNLSH